MLTDNPILIKAAQKNYDKFPVPTSEVVAKKTKRKYNWNEQADLDIATSVNLIAEIINLAQELNTLFWITSMLAVLTKSWKKFIWILLS